MAQINHTNVETALRLANHWCGHSRKVMDCLKGLSSKRGAIFVLPLINNLIKPHQMESNSESYNKLLSLIKDEKITISYKRNLDFLTIFLYTESNLNPTFLNKVFHFLYTIIWNDYFAVLLGILLSVLIDWYFFIFVFLFYIVVSKLILWKVGKKLISKKVQSSEDWFNGMYLNGYLVLKEPKFNKYISTPDSWEIAINHINKNES